MGIKTFNSLDHFLDDHPGMSTAPCLDAGICLRGKFRFRTDVSGNNEIEDSYELEIFVPDKFPQALPKVKETGGKIPRESNFHVNPDGSLCLGSPLILLKKIHNAPSLSGFVYKCLVPYLYAVSYKLVHGGDFVFGELDHGNQGIMDDYSIMFNLPKKFQITQAIELLSVRKRIANKQPCPCGCGKRLGVCSFRFKLNKFRKMAPVSWFKAHALNNWNLI